MGRRSWTIRRDSKRPGGGETPARLTAVRSANRDVFNTHRAYPISADAFGKG